MSEQIEEQLGGVLKDLAGYWGNLDFAGVRSLWDPEADRPFYLPEESEQLLVGWDAIEAYWAKTKATISRLSMRIWDLQARLLEPDLAVAVYQMHWNGDVSAYGRALGGENRVTAIFRRRGQRWYFCHYVEAPLAPMLYVQRLYALDVDPEFQAGNDG